LILEKERDLKGVNRFGKLENIHLTEDDWKFRWDQNLTPFHRCEVDPYLLKYEHMLLAKNNRVFVPLCGKTLDLIYLADKGHDVFGCELTKKGVIDFFTENSLEYTCEVKKLSSYSINIYKAISKRITIYQGDVFTVSSEIIGKFDAIWDRAAFEAIDPLKRSEYVRIMLDLLQHNGKCLLVTNVMSNVQFSGPPYSVSLDEIQELFESIYDITLLETNKDEKFEKVSSKFRHTHILSLKSTN